MANPASLKRPVWPPKIGIALIMNVFLLLDYSRIKKKVKCINEKYQNKLTLQECAHACRASSENFAFGKNNCIGEKCECWCQFGTENYKCLSITENKGFDLYTLTPIKCKS